MARVIVWRDSNGELVSPQYEAPESTCFVFMVEVRRHSESLPIVAFDPWIRWTYPLSSCSGFVIESCLLNYRLLFSHMDDTFHREFQMDTRVTLFHTPLFVGVGGGSLFASKTEVV